MTRTILIAFAIVGTWGSSVAYAQSGSERSRIEMLLSGYHDAPSRKSLERASADPLPILLDLSVDPGVRSKVRASALHAMRLFPEDDRVWRRYIDQLEDSWSVPAPASAHTVLLSMPQGFGIRATEVLLFYLEHPDPQLRMTSAHALGTLRTARGYLAIHARAARESDKVVRQYLEEQARK